MKSKSTDIFCPSCSLNLIYVTPQREKSNLLLIRQCPRCGRGVPEGRRQTMGQVWANRFGTSLLILWVMLCCGFVGGAFGAYCGLFSLAWEATSNNRFENADGQNVEQRFIAGKVRYFLISDPNAEVEEKQVRWTRRVANWIPGSSAPAGPKYGVSDAGEACIALVFILLAHLILSMLLAVLSWHWRRGWVWIWLALPCLAAALITYIEVNTSHISWGIQTVDYTLTTIPPTVLAVMLLTMIPAVTFNRSVARMLLTITLPPRARALFGFLWTRDRMKPPITVQN